MIHPASPFALLDGPAPTRVLGWRGNLVRFVLDPIGYMTPLAERSTRVTITDLLLVEQPSWTCFHPIGTSEAVEDLP